MPGRVATADRLIGRFGLQAVLRRPAAATQWSPGSSPSTDYPIKAVLANYTVAERANTLIQQADRKSWVLRKNGDGMTVLAFAHSGANRDNEMRSIFPEKE